jgi:sepiapterin reductase
MYHACLAKELPAMDKSNDSATAAATGTTAGNLCLKYLNYAPGPLETDMTTQLRSEQHLDVNLKTFFQNTLIDPIDSARVLVRLVLENDFENGQHIDYYDIVPPPPQQQQEPTNEVT